MLASAGRGTGGYLATIQVETRALDASCEVAMGFVQPAMALADVIGAHVLRGDPHLGQQPTAEKKYRESRGDLDRTVGLALLIDGLDLESTSAALDRILDLASDDIEGTPISTLYRTQHVIVRDDVAS